MRQRDSGEQLKAALHFLVLEHGLQLTEEPYDPRWDWTRLSYRGATLSIRASYNSRDSYEVLAVVHAVGPTELSILTLQGAISDVTPADDLDWIRDLRAQAPFVRENFALIARLPAALHQDWRQLTSEHAPKWRYALEARFGAGSPAMQAELDRMTRLREYFRGGEGAA